MDKKIKSIKFVLENCESISVPYECLDKFEYVADKTKTDEDHTGYITNLDCIVKDNGNMEYGMTWDGNETTPIQRLNKYNDICWIDIFYEDGLKENYGVNWYYDEDDEYCNSQNNENQTNKLINYKTLHIIVKPYVPKYSIMDIFDFSFDKDTTFKGKDDSKIYEVKLSDKGKYILNIGDLTEQQIRQSYIKINTNL